MKNSAIVARVKRRVYKISFFALFFLLFSMKAEGVLHSFLKTTRPEPNVLMLLDTSGSMNYRIDSETWTWGDGSRPLRSGNSIIARYFGVDRNPGENRTNNNDMREDFNYHPNLKYINNADLSGISVSERNEYFARQTSLDPAPQTISGESIYKYPNDSRMYALKNVMFRLLSDANIYRGLRIALSTYHQNYHSSPLTPEAGSNWYRWLPWGELRYSWRWNYWYWTGGDLQSLQWSGGNDTGLLREPFLSTSNSTHLANLKNWFDGNPGYRELRSIGGTPLSYSIFNSVIDSDPDNYSTSTGTALQFFRAPGVITDPCQDNWYIILTDGANTQGGGEPEDAVYNLCINSSDDLYVNGSDEKNKKGIKAFVIGLILPTNTSLAATLNDMAANGRTGKPAYLVNDMQGLFTALRDIFSEIQKSSAGLAPLVSPPRTSEDEDVAFVASYTSRPGKQWLGSLTKYNAVVANDGTLSYTKEWEAAERLSNIAWDARAIFTSFAGLVGATTNLYSFSDAVDNPLITSNSILGIPNQIDRERFVQWLRGKDVYEEEDGEELHKLYDICNSGLVKVGAPSAPVWDTSYAQFREENKNRDVLIYVQSNAGMLHAFNNENGNEHFAFIPPNVLYNGRLRGLRWHDKGIDYERGAASFSRYLLDGPLTVEDVWIGGKYRTVLLGLLGFGGAGVYALDISDAAPGKAEFLWAIENAIYGYDNANEEVIVKIKDERKVLVWKGSGNTTLPVIEHPHEPLGNTPFDTKYDFRRLRRPVGSPFVGRVFLKESSENPKWIWSFILTSGSTAGVYADYDSPGAVYIVEMGNGSILKKFDVAAPLMSSVITLPESLYKEVRTFFVADASGKVYKGDISNKDKSSWRMDEVLKFPSGTSGISSSLNALRVKQQVWVFAGTGDVTGHLLTKTTDANYFAAANVTGVQPNSPLEVKNEVNHLFPLNPEVGSEKLETDFYPDRKGWFIKLAEKERMSTPPKLLSGHVFFFTFIPDDDICSDNGKTRFYILNEKNGKSAWDPIEETTKKYKEYPGKKVTGFDLRSNPGGGVSAILPDGSVLKLTLTLETPSIVGEPLYWKSR